MSASRFIKKNVQLSLSQCENLADFIELNLLDDIRRDPDMDNLDYLRDLLEAQTILRNALKGEET